MTYNPMSKEFQDECKKFGLTGCQLTVKYKKEGKSVEKDEVYNDKRKGNKNKKYSIEELLNFLIQFFEENGRVPTAKDFNNNPGYQNYATYRTRFGSWNNALKLVGMDLDTRVAQGNLNTSIEKARYAELKIIKHFIQHPIDLAGKNCNSPCDGACPNGKTYDVKSSKLYYKEFYSFETRNKYKEEIEIYYLLGFNKDWTKFDYGWRIPGEIAESDHFRIGLRSSYKFNIDNMEEYDITDKLRYILI